MQVYGGNAVQHVPENVKTVSRGESRTTAPVTDETDFKSILQNSILQTNGNTALQFSRHANTRLSSREISLSNEQIKRVEGAIAKANEKGIKDSLVLVDDVALVVNIKSKVVVTAMNQANENVFTNIDGAIIV